MEATSMKNGYYKDHNNAVGLIKDGKYKIIISDYIGNRNKCRKIPDWWNPEEIRKSIMTPKKATEYLVKLEPFYAKYERPEYTTVWLIDKRVGEQYYGQRIAATSNLPLHIEIPCGYNRANSSWHILSEKEVLAVKLEAL